MSSHSAGLLYIIWTHKKVPKFTGEYLETTKGRYFKIWTRHKFEMVVFERRTLRRMPNGIIQYSIKHDSQDGYFGKRDNLLLSRRNGSLSCQFKTAISCANKVENGSLVRSKVLILVNYRASDGSEFGKHKVWVRTYDNRAGPARRMRESGSWTMFPRYWIYIKSSMQVSDLEFNPKLFQDSFSPTFTIVQILKTTFIFSLPLYAFFCHYTSYSSICSLL